MWFVCKIKFILLLSQQHFTRTIFSHLRCCPTINATVYILDAEWIFVFVQEQVGRAANREADADVAVKCHFHFHLPLSRYKGASPPCHLRVHKSAGWFAYTKPSQVVKLELRVFVVVDQEGMRITFCYFFIPSPAVWSKKTMLCLLLKKLGQNFIPIQARDPFLQSCYCHITIIMIISWLWHRAHIDSANIDRGRGSLERRCWVFWNGNKGTCCHKPQLRLLVLLPFNRQPHIAEDKT